MTNMVVLDPNIHGNLCVCSPQDNTTIFETHLAHALLLELPSLVVRYPVIFVKNNQTGQFELNVMFGFEHSENLFLRAGSWSSGYIPMQLKCAPFGVGFNDEGSDTTNARILIDLDSELIQENNGEYLFQAEKRPSTYLRSAMGLLSSVAKGYTQNKHFIVRLLELNLIEPARLDISFADGNQCKFDGLYTINTDVLEALPRSVINELQERGYFEACQLLVKSLANIQGLIDLKNTQ